MSEDTKKKVFKKPSRRTLIVAGAVVIACGLVWIVFSLGIFGGGIGTKKVDFEQLSKDNIPQSIETEVIPEYRELERALGCLVDGKVYVVVTRGDLIVPVGQLCRDCCRELYGSDDLGTTAESEICKI